jgi:glycosyltransferase involved in cell wall biosynthesis
MQTERGAGTIMTLGLGVEIMRGSGASWRGGSVLFGDLMRALRETYPTDLRVLLVQPADGTPFPADMVPLSDATVSYPRLKRWTGTWAWNHARQRLARTDLLPDRMLKQMGIHVLLCGVLERWTSLPTLALLTDFQHRHLPEMFDATEIRWRDQQFAKTAARASLVLVTTNSVLADLVNFVPQYASKARVLPPVSYVPPDTYDLPPAEILDTYALPQKFVYLPNQFWQHKNHMTAFEAVRSLVAGGMEINVVCTGAPIDSRNAAYFSEILQALARWKIRKQVLLLGSVPRSVVFALIRQAVCVLNPSRFEGFGLSLGEARAVGKRVVVSDIPPHREQNVPCAEYFEPLDPDDLAAKLAMVWEATEPGPDPALEARARQAQPARVRAYAENFMALVREVSA